MTVSPTAAQVIATDAKSLLVRSQTARIAGSATQALLSDLEEAIEQAEQASRVETAVGLRCELLRHLLDETDYEGARHVWSVLATVSHTTLADQVDADRRMAGAVFYDAMSSPDSVGAYLTSALDLYRATELWPGVVEAEFRLAMAFAKYGSSPEEVVRRLELAGAISNEHDVRSVYSVLVNIERARRHPPREWGAARVLLENARRMAGEIGASRALSNVDQGWGDAYLARGQTDSALHYYRQALFREAGASVGSSKTIGDLHVQVADIHIERGDADSALWHFTQALSPGSSRQTASVGSFIRGGKLSLWLRRFDVATEWLQIAATRIRSSGGRTNLVDVSGRLAAAELLSGDDQKARRSVRLALNYRAGEEDGSLDVALGMLVVTDEPGGPRASAERHFRLGIDHAIQSGGDEAVVWALYQYGLALERLGETARARAQWQAAWELAARKALIIQRTVLADVLGL